MQAYYSTTCAVLLISQRNNVFKSYCTAGLPRFAREGAHPLPVPLVDPFLYVNPFSNPAYAPDLSGTISLYTVFACQNDKCNHYCVIMGASLYGTCTCIRQNKYIYYRRFIIAHEKTAACKVYAIPYEKCGVVIRLPKASWPDRPHHTLSLY